MTNMLAWGASWLSDQLKQSAGESIIYRRGTDAIELVATIGATEYEADDGYGITVRLTSKDFLFEAAELILGGRVTVPQAGDVIDVQTCGGYERWEVMPITSGGQCYNLDPQGIRLRVHTRQTKVV